MTLVESLTAYGWFEEDARDAAAAFETGGVEAVRAAFVWLDDEEHDYSGEMVDCVEAWKRRLEVAPVVFDEMLIAPAMLFHPIRGVGADSDVRLGTIKTDNNESP